VGNVFTKARVQVTVEVDAGSWDATCTSQQVFDQASSRGLECVRRMIQNQPGAWVVGEPSVTFITAKRP